MGGGGPMDDDYYRRGGGGNGGPPMMHRDGPYGGGVGGGGYHDRGHYNQGGMNPYGGGAYGNGGYGPPPPQAQAPLGGRGLGGAAAAAAGGRRRSRRSGNDGVSLLVRNLSADITTQDLEQAFRRIGDVRDVYIPTDYHSREPKGFAFVEYATREEASDAKNEMNRFVMKGRALEVLFAQEKRKTPVEMKGRSDGSRFDGEAGGGGSGAGGGLGRDARSSSFERHLERERKGMGASGPPR